MYLPAIGPQLRVARAAAYTLACSQRAMFATAFGAPDEKVRGHAKAWAEGFEERFGTVVRAEGLERVDWSRPCIVMANHQSYLDVLALFRSMPNAFGFVAKKALFKVPAFGGVMRAVGCVPVDRGNRGDAVSSMKSAAAEVKAGATICVFPEGTRSAGDRVQRLKKGPFYLAQLAAVPTVPVGIRGTSDCMPRTNSRLDAGDIRVRFGDPIAPIGADGPGPRNALQAKIRAEIGRLAELPLVD